MESQCEYIVPIGSSLCQQSGSLIWLFYTLTMPGSKKCQSLVVSGLGVRYVRDIYDQSLQATEIGSTFVTPYILCFKPLSSFLSWSGGRNCVTRTCESGKVTRRLCNSQQCMLSTFEECFLSWIRVEQAGSGYSRQCAKIAEM